MTRELKLGLIVGFSVLLLVGILISDHFSQAHRDKVAEVLPDEASAVLPRERPELADPVTDQTPATSTAGAVVPPPLSPATDTAASNGQVGVQPDPTESPTSPLPDPGTSGVSTLASGNTVPPGSITDPLAHAPGGGSPGGLEPTVHGNDQFIVINQGKPAAGSDAPGVVVPDPKTVAAAPDAALQNPPKSKPSATKTHVVKKGETLYKIASTHYGNGNAWKRIADANPGKIGPDGSIRLGVTLVIPEAPIAKPAATPSAIAKKPEPPKDAPKSKAKGSDGAVRLASYTVKKGDTLGDISKSVLGSSRRWREILALNQDEIDDEDDIRVGMVLKVPAG